VMGLVEQPVRRSGFSLLASAGVVTGTGLTLGPG
jgi:hypothetical protein